MKTRSEWIWQAIEEAKKRRRKEEEQREAEKCKLMKKENGQ